MKPFWQLHRWHLLLSYYQGVCKIVTRYKGWPEEPQIVSHLAGGLARERRAVKHHCTRHPPPPTSPSTASASFNTIHPLHHHHYRQVSSQCFNAGSTYNLRSLPLLLASLHHHRQRHAPSPYFHLYRPARPEIINRSIATLR